MRRLLTAAAILAVAGCQGRTANPVSPSAIGGGDGSMASRYANATYVASRGYEQFQVIERNQNGLATAWNTKLIWAPALYKYTTGPYVIKEDRGTHQWTLVIMDAAAVIAPQAGQDTDVQVIPDRTLDQVLTGNRLNQMNDWLAKTDFGVTATSGQTVRQVLTAVLVALNHSPDAPAEL
jgi:hypothetical protein